jgi:3-hydroxyisobutyrate dehydrogenase-like beta-hydroxyacid dehydrogenase
MRVAFLGLGKMGLPIARLMLNRGYGLTVWNRTTDRAAPLKEAGAEIAPSPAAAVQGASIVFTMFANDASTEAVVFGEDGTSGILENLSADAVHACLATISVDLSQRLERAHNQRGQHFIAAPVFGRPMIAEQGKLWVVVAGNAQAVERTRSWLAAVSRGLTVLAEEPWRANAVKLGGNFMIFAMTQTLSEAFVFAQSQGIDPASFLETVNSALFQSTFYAQYGNTILHPPQSYQATVALGLKDISLFRDVAAAASRKLGLADYIAQQLTVAQSSGMRDEDWAVAQYRIAEKTSKG